MTTPPKTLEPQTKSHEAETNSLLDSTKIIADLAQEVADNVVAQVKANYIKEIEKRLEKLAMKEKLSETNEQKEGQYTDEDFVILEDLEDDDDVEPVYEVAVDYDVEEKGE